MIFRKINISDRDAIKKRRVQANSVVSILREEFDCESLTAWSNLNQPPIGVSKLEHLVSDHWKVKGFWSDFNGA